MWQECMNRSMGLKPTFICIALFMAGYALAQDQKPDNQKAKDQKALDQKPPEQKQAEQDANQTYEGPSILSREFCLIVPIIYGGFSGADQFLNLAFAHVLKRRLLLDLKETVGTSTLANGSFAYLPLTNTDLFAVPANELFDSRTKFLQSRVDLTWQHTARLSIGLGGEGFLVRRASLALAGLNGYSARANVAYRLTRRQTFSAGYNYSYFDFQRTFGNAKLQTATLGYSIGLSRRWDFSMQVGGIRIETLGLTQVSIDPAIAAIVGRNVAVVTFFRQL